ncbi:MAG: hypothetical protein F6K31_25500 [Symploca sp. SIO2G7]|nr:hypothetical protein [Symploca sp. SIO2G7]
MMQALTRLTLDHPDYYYDRKTNRYKYKDTNRFAPKQAILALTKKYRDHSKADLIKLAHQYHSGQLSLEQFQRLAASNIKQIHLAEAILGAGGVEVMTPARFLIVARQLKRQYYTGIDPLTRDRFGLKHLAADIVDGISEAQLANRLRMYGDAAKVSFWSVKTDVARSQDNTEARRVLGRTHQHCEQCLRYAALGWVSIEQLILPTQQCECRSQCKCTVEFRSLHTLNKKPQRK